MECSFVRDLPRGQPHRETFLQLKYCDVDTSLWQLPLRQLWPDEVEPQRGSRLQSRAETSARILPENELNGSVIDLVETLKNLFPPSFFGGGIDLLIQTADWRID